MLKFAQVYVSDRDNELIKRAIESLEFYQKLKHKGNTNSLCDIESLKQLHQDFDEAIKEENDQ